MIYLRCSSIHAHIKYVPAHYHRVILIYGKVTYRYYIGMLKFLSEDYAKVCVTFLLERGTLTPKQSEEELTLAFYQCHIEAHANQEYVMLSSMPSLITL